MSKKEERYQILVAQTRAYDRQDRAQRLGQQQKMLGASIDITFALDRTNYDVQLSFTPDLSQKEKMEVLKVMKAWVAKYENTGIIPDDQLLEKQQLFLSQ